LVGVSGGHPDIDHGQVRLVLGDRPEELLGIGHGRYDLESASVSEQPSQPVPEQHRVLRAHDSHGRSAAITVRPPSGLSMVSVPSTEAARCARPLRPVRLCPMPVSAWTAPPCPLSVTTTRSSSPSRVTLTSA